jgi:hypothetical protein
VFVLARILLHILLTDHGLFANRDDPVTGAVCPTFSRLYKEIIYQTHVIIDPVAFGGIDDAQLRTIHGNFRLDAYEAMGAGFRSCNNALYLLAIRTIRGRAF